MNWLVNTANKGADVVATIVAKNPCKVQLIASCLDTDVVFCFRKEMIPKGKSEIFMKVPFSPRNMLVNIIGDIPNNMRVNVYAMPCKSYQIPIGPTQIEFIEFAQAMAWAVMNGKIVPSDKIYTSANGNFQIVIFPRILDYYGRAVGSPASVDADKKVFLIDYNLITEYTVAGMIGLLCHEYAHVFANEKEGYEAKSEEGADKFGLRLFLAAGYGESEYLNALKKTFKRVDTNQNRNRMKLILNLSKEINQGKIYGKPY